MPQEFRDVHDIDLVCQQMGGNRMPKTVGRDWFFQFCVPNHGLDHCRVDRRFVERPPALVEESELQEFYETGNKRGINPDHASKLARILDRLDASVRPSDLLGLL